MVDRNEDKQKQQQRQAQPGQQQPHKQAQPGQKSPNFREGNEHDREGKQNKDKNNQFRNKE